MTLDKECTHSCFDCGYIMDDSECGDYGSTLYTNWICRKREDEIADNKEFPFENAPKECFRLDFWHSPFSDCLDGTQEQINQAYKAYDEWYEAEYGADGP